MHGVTTAIVLFIFGCIAYPQLVKRRSQYYAAVAAILCLLLLGCVDEMIGSAGFHHFFGAVMYLIDFLAMLMLLMSTGGLTVRELAGHMGEALEEFRQGGEASKPLIVPLTGEQPKPRKERPVGGAGGIVEEMEAPRTVAPVAPRAVRRPPRDNSAIPLE